MIIKIMGILFLGIGVVGVIYCIIKNRKDLMKAIKKEVKEHNRVG